MFEEVYNLMCEEKKKPELREIPKDTFSKSMEYYNKLFLEEKSSLEEFDKHRESKNFIKMVKRFYDLRLKKIIEMSFWSSMDESSLIYVQDNLPEHEKEFFDKILKIMVEYKFKIKKKETS